MYIIICTIWTLVCVRPSFLYHRHHTFLLTPTVNLSFGHHCRDVHLIYLHYLYRQAGVYQKWITAILRHTYVHFLKGKYHKYQCKRRLLNNHVLLKFSTRVQIFTRIQLNISVKRSTLIKLKLFKNKNNDKYDLKTYTWASYLTILTRGIRQSDRGR